jgi:sulfate adenylyltransferase subunit 2
LKDTIAEYKFRALYLGIRRDEHGVRAKERVFSPRNQDFKWDYKNQPPELWDQYKAQAEEQEHIRVHPLLHWTELDIWEYIKREKIPITDLYFAKDGKRYRSIGCECCCSPINSNADDIDKIVQELKTTKQGERAGRAQDKEEANAMQKLRALGYM